MNKAIKNIKGLRSGKLLVVDFAGFSHPRTRHSAWNCLCDCGKTTVAFSGNLKAGTKRSCGCLKSSCQVKHGKSESVEYAAYHGAKHRCNNPNNPLYAEYGGRGIEFKFKSFLEFFAHVGPRPEGFSLDRKDNDGHYEFGNVRWATQREQLMNRGRLSYIEVERDELLVAYAQAACGVQ